MWKAKGKKKEELKIHEEESTEELSRKKKENQSLHVRIMNRDTGGEVTGKESNCTPLSLVASILWPSQTGSRSRLGNSQYSGQAGSCSASSRSQSSKAASPHKCSLSSHSLCRDGDRKSYFVSVSSLTF